MCNLRSTVEFPELPTWIARERWIVVDVATEYINPRIWGRFKWIFQPVSKNLDSTYFTVTDGTNWKTANWLINKTDLKT